MTSEENDKLLSAPEDTIEYVDDEDYARRVILAWNKPIPREWDNDKMKFFSPVEHRAEIKALARGLTIEEALNFYGLVPGVLSDYEALYFVTTFLQGRMKAKSEAVNHLFDNMRASVGSSSASVQAAAMYLKNFAQSFQEMDNTGTGIKAIEIKVVE